MTEATGEEGTPRGNDFLDLASRGRNGPWRYILAIATIGLTWVGLSMALGLVVGVAIGFQAAATDSAPRFAGSGSLLGFGPLADYVFINLTFLPLLLGLFIGMRYIHRRPFRTLVTAGDRVNWRQIARSASVFFVILAALTGLQSVAMPGSFVLSFDAAAFAAFLPLALLLTPIQAMSEELLMRGYLMQMIGRLTARRWVVAAATSVLFALLHAANPESADSPVAAMLFYAGFGLFMALVTLKANGLEPAMGIHTANNLFTVLLVNPESSVLPSPSVATYLDPMAAVDLAMLLAAAVLFWLAMPWLVGNRSARMPARRPQEG